MNHYYFYEDERYDLDDDEHEAIKEIETELDIELGEIDKNVGVFYDFKFWQGYAVNKKHVFRLCLSSANIKNLNRIISSLKKFKYLSELDLCNNEISDISPLKDLSNLTELGLGHNEISDLSPLKNLNNLKRLDLHYNKKISDILPLKDLDKIQHLILSANQISDISPLKNLFEIKNPFYFIALELQNNSIKELPSWIADFDMDVLWKTYLLKEGIFLGGNPLEIPPVEIVKKGNTAIQNYFEQRAIQLKALETARLKRIAEEKARAEKARLEEVAKIKALEEKVRLRDERLHKKEIRKALILFEQLRKDIFEKLDIEIEDEIKRKFIVDQFRHVERALSEVETTVIVNNQEVLDDRTENTLNFFVARISIKKTPNAKALQSVLVGTEKFNEFADVYNKFAPFFDLSIIPLLS